MRRGFLAACLVTGFLSAVGPVRAQMPADGAPVGQTSPQPAQPGQAPAPQAAPPPEYPESAVMAPLPPASVTRIAIVDIQRLQEEASAARSLERTLYAERERITRELQVEEQRLRAAEAELVQLRQTLPPEAFDSRRRAFEDTYMELRKLNDARIRRSEQALEVGQQTLRTAILEAIRAIAQERGLSLVLQRNQTLLYLGPGTEDITGLVLGRLDAELPEIRIDLPNN